MSYSITIENFASLQERWQQLLPDCAVNHIFLTPQWQSAWWQAFGSESKMLLLAAQQDGQLAGIAPLRLKGDTLSFIGNYDVCDYMDFIARRDQEPAVMTQFLDYLAQVNWQHISLHSLLPQSLALTFFVPAARERGYRVEISQEDVSPELILPSTWEEYLSRLGKKDRHEIRRKMRRMEEAGTPRFFTISDEDQMAGELDEFFRLFKLSAGEKADFMTPPRRVFFKNLTRLLGAAGYFKLSCLELDGRNVSYIIYFEYQNELYLYNSAYDPAYASLNTGLILKLHCLREGIAGGEKRFDFLRGNERYKYEMGGQDVPVYRCIITRG